MSLLRLRILQTDSSNNASQVWSPTLLSFKFKANHSTVLLEVIYSVISFSARSRRGWRYTQWPFDMRTLLQFQLTERQNFQRVFVRLHLSHVNWPYFEVSIRRWNLVERSHHHDQDVLSCSYRSDDRQSTHRKIIPLSDSVTKLCDSCNILVW